MPSSERACRGLRGMSTVALADDACGASEGHTIESIDRIIGAILEGGGVYACQFAGGREREVIE